MTRNLLAAPRRLPAGEAVRPPLTSLVDMMVILLVFLLKSFSVDGQLVTPAADLQLPSSSCEVVAEPALGVEVTMAGINLEGVPVASLSDDASSLLIPELEAALRDARGASTARQANVQCDRRVDFAVLKRVLATCSAAGYDDLSLLVQREAM